MTPELAVGFKPIIVALQGCHSTFSDLVSSVEACEQDQGAEKNGKADLHSLVPVQAKISEELPDCVRDDA